MRSGARLDSARMIQAREVEGHLGPIALERKAAHRLSPQEGAGISATPEGLESAADDVDLDRHDGSARAPIVPGSRRSARVARLSSGASAVSTTWTLRDRIHQAAGATRARRGTGRRLCESHSPRLASRTHAPNYGAMGPGALSLGRPAGPASRPRLSGSENSSTLHCETRPRVARGAGAIRAVEPKLRSKSRRRQVGGRVRPSEGAPRASHSRAAGGARRAEATRSVPDPSPAGLAPATRPGRLSGPACSPRRPTILMRRESRRRCSSDGRSPRSSCRAAPCPYEPTCRARRRAPIPCR